MDNICNKWEKPIKMHKLLPHHAWGQCFSLNRSRMQSHGHRLQYLSSKSVRLTKHCSYSMVFKWDHGQKWLDIVTYTMIMLQIPHEVHSLQCYLHLTVTKLLSDRLVWFTEINKKYHWCSNSQVYIHPTSFKLTFVAENDS